MAHVPEHTTLYVCESCQTVLAGTVQGQPPDHSFEAPAECAACGSSDFVELQNYPNR